MIYITVVTLIILIALFLLGINLELEEQIEKLNVAELRELESVEETNK